VRRSIVYLPVCSSLWVTIADRISYIENIH
jgi:hypothetical protein